MVEEKLPEATSGMTEDIDIGAYVWAAASQPARFSYHFSGWNRTASGLPGRRNARLLKNGSQVAKNDSTALRNVPNRVASSQTTLCA